MNDKDSNRTAHDRATGELAEWLAGRGSTVMAVLVAILVIGLVASFFW